MTLKGGEVKLQKYVTRKNCENAENAEKWEVKLWSWAKNATISKWSDFTSAPPSPYMGKAAVQTPWVLKNRWLPKHLWQISIFEDFCAPLRGNKPNNVFFVEPSFLCRFKNLISSHRGIDTKCNRENSSFMQNLLILSIFFEVSSANNSHLKNVSHLPGGGRKWQSCLSRQMTPKCSWGNSYMVCVCF